MSGGNSSNVVHLRGSRAGGDMLRNAKSPALLVELQDKGRQRLMGLLQELFDNSDDALFDLADRAENNAEQNLYFESMRELRIKRRGIENRFSQSIQDSFRLLAIEATTKTRTELDDITEDDLSLVANDELEELVAVDGMISKAMSLYPMALSQLTLRIGGVTGHKIDSRRNPLGPAVVCHAFLDACKDLEIDIRAKLVVFKLFDKFVVSKLGSVLEVANQLLVAAGIMPTIATETPRRRKTPATETAGEDAGLMGQVVGAEADDQVWNDLQQLLHGQTPPGTPPAHAGVAASAPALSRQNMMQLLSQLQQQQWQQMQTDIATQGAYSLPLPSQLNVPTMLDQVMRKQDTSAHSIGQVEGDVINLVQMLFQFILDDRNLATPLKALIARLQIPMIKVALQDKTFFSRGGHPARKLLNEIATASLGWSSTDRGAEALFNKVESVVNRVLNDFDSDLNLFPDLLADFVAFIEREKHRAGLVLQRTIDAEDGRAKSESARAHVQKVIENLIAGRPLPDIGLKILHDSWSNVLFLMYLKHGDTSEEWRLGIETAEQLVWSLGPVEQISDRQALLRQVPNLLKALREGLGKIGLNPHDMQQIFSELEREHLLRIKGKPAQTETSLDTALATPASDLADARPMPTADSLLAGAGVPAEEAAPEWLLKVESLREGTWVEMTQGDSKFRCKLAAIIRATGKYIFVNRSGQKVAENTREGLALDLQYGKVALLDDGLLFDRALQSVIGNLRTYNKK
jgi:hypothetical protein